MARRFRLRRVTFDLWLKQCHDEGRVDPKPLRGQTRPLMRDAAQVALCRLVTAENHLTLCKYRDRLVTEIRIRVHSWAVRCALQCPRLTQKGKRDASPSGRMQPCMPASISNTVER